MEAGRSRLGKRPGMTASTAAGPRTKPPFRADHVGSLLRPDAVKQARDKYLGPQTPTTSLGPHESAELRAVEDDCVRELIAMQEGVGLRAATDGELRRRSWWLELILGWEGFEADRTGNTKIQWRNASGPTQGFSQLKVVGKIKWRPSSTVRAFEFLKANAKAVPKVTLPAPNNVHFYIGGPENVDKRFYADHRAVWDDLVAAYRQEIAALVAAGATYIQYDDTAFPFLCDPVHRAYVQSWGDDPDQLLHTYAEKINDTLSGRPAGVTVTLHQCRGNREGNWAAEGAYDPVAEVLFNGVDVDGYFLEYDTARAGGFEPLRFLPRGKVAALGVISSKTPVLENVDDVMRRIDQAAKFAPIDQLALCPQCGFASSVGGNPITADQQRAKLQRMVEIATRVWGGV
jgi:5-methyltetrahydropteroyltriglutamate--homocysteine methyltransferase